MSFPQTVPVDMTSTAEVGFLKAICYLWNPANIVKDGALARWQCLQNFEYLVQDAA